VSGIAEVLLGVIALATVVMATIQIRLSILAVQLGRRVDELSQQIEKDVRPLLANASAVAENAARASALAVVQVERADRLFSELSQRVDETMAIVQGALLAPAREGRALLAAVTAAFGAFRDLRVASRSRAAAADEEESLFIG
jgi:hypothetical protein